MFCKYYQQSQTETALKKVEKLKLKKAKDDKKKKNAIKIIKNLKKYQIDK